MASSLHINAQIEIPCSELQFRTSRSGGPGGQNVNKLETRVELLFDVRTSPSLTEQQRHLLVERLGSRVDSDGILHISSQRSRSQWENKQATIKKLVSLLRSAFAIRKKRVKTAPTKGSKEIRLQRKKRHARKKKLRTVRHADE